MATRNGEIATHNSGGIKKANQKCPKGHLVGQEKIIRQKGCHQGMLKALDMISKDAKGSKKYIEDIGMLQNIYYFIIFSKTRGVRGHWETWQEIGQHCKGSIF